MNQEIKESYIARYNAAKEMLSLSLEDLRICANYAEEQNNEKVRDLFLKAYELKSNSRKPDLNLYTLEEVAETLKVSTKTVSNYINRGRIQANKIMGKWMITAEELENFVKG